MNISRVWYRAAEAPETHVENIPKGPRTCAWCDLTVVPSNIALAKAGSPL